MCSSVFLPSWQPDFFSLITPFICDIWLSPAYELGWGTAVLCIVVLLIKIMGLPLSLMMGVTGLFEKEKMQAHQVRF